MTFQFWHALFFARGCSCDLSPQTQRSLVLSCVSRSNRQRINQHNTRAQIIRLIIQAVFRIEKLGPPQTWLINLTNKVDKTQNHMDKDDRVLYGYFCRPTYAFER